MSMITLFRFAGLTTSLFWLALFTRLDQPIGALVAALVSAFLCVLPSED